MLNTKKPSVNRSSTSKTKKTAALSSKNNAVTKKSSAAGIRGAVKKGRPGKKAVVRKKVSRKRAAATSTSPTSPASPQSGPRKGRPVSVDVLQRKLADSLTALKTEKRKRQQLAKNARQIARTAVMERRKLKNQIVELKENLSELQNEKKSAEKQAVRQQKMEIARNAAVGRFLERWEKNYQQKSAAPAVKSRRRKRGRRAAS